MIARRLLCALALSGLPAIPWAQSLPPSLRSCAAEANAERRHACYDREVTRLLDAEKGASGRQAEAPPQSAAVPSAAAGPRAEATSREPPLERASRKRSTAGHAGDRLRASIVSVEDTPDELVLHLDNGDVWEQTDRTSGGLGLRPGDAVTIEKHLGSYWLSARHVSGMRVRKRSE